MKTLILLTAFSITLITATTTQAGWFDWFEKKTDEVIDAVKSGDTSKMVEVALSNEQIANALKQALDKGADFAVEELGKAGGFENNPKVRIPMPESLQSVEKILRKVGQDKYADEFEMTMNSAAEQAVPLTLNVLKEAIKQMTVEDARAILDGETDAATQYLKRVGSDDLRRQISPIVQDATAKTGVTKVYKTMYDKMGFAGEYINLEDYDVDRYVTDKTMEGLFVKIAEEEKKIRENPQERTTELLKQVFGG
ncbi:MAG: DUF4197 domain-containing protein [Gammaproteobacteria bacterium]|nr:DUF4197 domain-containing protein [Gammaproteobacteria bacterium]